MKRIVGKRPNVMEEELKSNSNLTEKLSQLPSNYNFEIYKTLIRIKQLNATKVGLQFPEGLQQYACLISDIIAEFGNLSKCIILADIVYGACCVDDIHSDELGLDLLVHYGHSCLVPINETCIKTLYIFVDIYINNDHLIRTLMLNFPDKDTPIALVGTVQFVQSINIAKQALEEQGYTEIIVPQSKPRTTGEVLGCTSPKISQQNIISVADGRFHLEAVMIQNPEATFYRYDPYQQKLFLDSYDLDGMKTRRLEAILKTRDANHIGIIMGTLGRQGSPHILNQLKKLCAETGKRTTLFMFSEITDEGLLKHSAIDAWIQIACPRLSIDWGTEFTKPILNPYEAFVAFRDIALDYPMDNYAYGGGPWSVYTAKEIETGSQQNGLKPKKIISTSKTVFAKLFVKQSYRYTI